MTVIRSMSTIGSANPARCNSPPASRTSVKGDTRAAADLELGFGQGFAQLVQRRPAEHGGEHDTVGLQRVTHLHQRPRQVVDPVQVESAHHGIEAAVTER